MSETSPPPPIAGGNSKYAVVGVLLLLLSSVGIWSIYRKPDPAPRPPPVRHLPDASVTAGPILNPGFVLPPELPDAGFPDTGPPVDVPVRIRYVTRYVGGCTGSIDIARVNATAQTNYGGLRDCYEHELRGNPALRGALSARMMINTSGRAEDVGVSTQMASRPFVACVKRTLQRISFPPAHGGCAIAEVRFNFSPRQ